MACEIAIPKRCHSCGKLYPGNRYAATTRFRVISRQYVLQPVAGPRFYVTPAAGAATSPYANLTVQVRASAAVATTAVKTSNPACRAAGEAIAAGGWRTVNVACFNIPRGPPFDLVISAMDSGGYREACCAEPREAHGCHAGSTAARAI